MINGPRIVLFDLEILPNLIEVMKYWTGLSAYPGLTLKANITSICCAGWKVLGEKKVHCINAWDFPEWQKDVNADRKLVQEIASVLDGADCVVTHNGKRFDWKFLQTRLLIHGLPPLPRILHVDTCAVSKSNLLLFNNRLNTLGDALTSEQKMEHEGWMLWVKTHQRDAKAMQIMEAYCKQDVLLLEKVFTRLRPFIKEMPNFNLFRDRDSEGCPNCESLDTTKEGLRYERNGTMQRWRCRKCLTPFKAPLEGPRVRTKFKTL